MLDRERQWIWGMLLYESGLKSFRPSLHKTRDKQPLDRVSNRSWCHCHTEYDKAFLVAVHGSMVIGGSIQAR